MLSAIYNLLKEQFRKMINSFRCCGDHFSFFLPGEVLSSSWPFFFILVQHLLTLLYWSKVNKLFEKKHMLTSWNCSLKNRILVTSTQILGPILEWSFQFLFLITITQSCVEWEVQEMWSSKCKYGFCGN